MVLPKILVLINAGHEAPSACRSTGLRSRMCVRMDFARESCAGGTRALVALRVHRLRVERRSEGLRGIVFSRLPIPAIGSISTAELLNARLHGKWLIVLGECQAPFLLAWRIDCS